MNKRSPSALAAAITISLAAAAGAQSTTEQSSPPRTSNASAQSADSADPMTSQRSGKSTMASKSGQRARPFTQVDKDGDGYLSRAELPQDSKLGDVFAGYDADDDGRLTRSEYETWTALEGSMRTSTAQSQSSATTSSSGSSAALGSSDRSTAADRSGDASMASNRGDTSAANRGSASMAGRDAGQGDTLAFTDIDRDGDGYLRESDINSEPALAGNFDALDRNADDRVSRSEFTAWQATLSGDQQRSLTQQDDDQDVPELQREQDR